MLPTHDPNTCVWKAGQWECLHALDADHFYLGDFLVDLVQLRREETRMGALPRFTDAQVHGIGFNLGSLRLYTRQLAKGESVEVANVQFVLRRLNQLGLHTGYPPWVPDNS